METLKVEELAKYLKLHEYTIRRLAKAGKIPSFKAGGQWRFDKLEIEQWRKGQSRRQYKIKE
jgi:excisionase family DNA binding protein